jgi:hypothetical protein
VSHCCECTCARTCTHTRLYLLLNCTYVTK